MATVIRLLDSTGNEVHDSISGDYEDSFCLETFADMCQNHFDAEPKDTKGLIIARVKTLDPKQPEKTFYSYYNAFHLNKTLFQTQIYLKKRYIHRLHVLNPLTNSDIIGTVCYYLVKPPTKNEKVIVEIAEFVAQHSENDGVETNHQSTTNDSNSKVMAERRGSQIVRMSVVYTSAAPINDTIMSTVDNQDCMVSTHKVVFEDSASKPQIPAALNRLQKTLTARHNDIPIVKAPKPAPTFVESIADITPLSSIRMNRPKLMITTQLPTGTLKVNGITSAPVSPGQITRFTVPITKEEMAILVPKTQRGNRRTLSYRNALSATGESASFVQWAQMVHRDQKELLNSDNTCNLEPGSHFDNVRSFATVQTDQVNTPTFLRSPLKLELIKDVDEDEDVVETAYPAKTVDITVTDKNKKPAPITTFNDDLVDETLPSIICWDAMLIATDDEFLESSKTRQLFRDNAIAGEDAKLFEMKEFTGDSESQDPDFEIIGEAFPCESCYPSVEELARMSKFRRALHAHKCIIVTTIVSLFSVAFILVMMLSKNK